MKHLTNEEIINYVTMTAIDERALQNASLVIGHITKCAACRKKVDAFRTVYDQFARDASGAASEEAKANLEKMFPPREKKVSLTGNDE